MLLCSHRVDIQKIKIKNNIIWIFIYSIRYFLYNRKSMRHIHRDFVTSKLIVHKSQEVIQWEKSMLSENRVCQ